MIVMWKTSMHLKGLSRQKSFPIKDYDCLTFNFSKLDISVPFIER